MVPECRACLAGTSLVPDLAACLGAIDVVGDELGDCDPALSCCSGRLPAEGEACDPAYPACARADNWCDPADGVCRRLAAAGDACEEVADNCVAYAWCSPEGRCVARPGEGEPCEDWPPCLGDLECLDDTCAVPPPAEEADCADG